MSWKEINNIEELEEFYKSLLPIIKETGRMHGYAIAVHGSMRRDLDLIAIPWIDSFSDKNVLAKAVQEATCGFTMSKYSWENKPNGRCATCFPICWPNRETMERQPSLGHIDLSVIAGEPHDPSRQG